MIPSTATLQRMALLAVLTATGAGLGILISLPIPLLTGPAILTTCVALTGLKLQFPIPFRNAVFLLAGVTIGATVSSESVAALARWPLAFGILAVALCLTLILGRITLQRLMRSDGKSALLAATPGHLSYVIAISEDQHLAIDRIAVVQSIRLLALTLLVPFAARLAGIDTGIGLANTPATMTLIQTALCIGAAAIIAPLITLARIPAPFLIAGMIIGATARLSGYAPGGLSPWIAYPVLATIGTLIGTRFSGITLSQLKTSALAGLANSILTASLALVAAWLAKDIVQMPLLHVLVAFAPGGLETMTVMALAIGANPGFVAAAHVGRLLFLSVLVPLLLIRTQGPLPPRH